MIEAAAKIIPTLARRTQEPIRPPIDIKQEVA
jgi:hypothetical protein